MKRFDRNLSFFLLLAVATLFYLPLGAHALWDSDEGRYAEIAREMLELKSWIVPHLNYVVYFEKPPLMYWLTALSMAIFGQNAFAARFWCAAFGLLTVWVTMKLAQEWRGERAALLAGSILATSVGFFALTQFLVLDMALTFWITLALFASARILRERSPEEIRRASGLFAVATAGGILTKGPVALVLPLIAVGLAGRYARMSLPLKKIPWIFAAGLCFVIAAPWFILVSLRHPFFVPFFFIHEHFARYLTTVHHRTAPFYFFIPVFLVGLLPWSVFLPKVLSTWFSHRREPLKRDSTAALLVIWILFVLFFFSLSQSKLAGYILPVFPAAAILIAAEFDEACREESMPRWLGGGLAALIVLYSLFLILLKWPRPLSFLSDPATQALLSQSGMLPLVLGLGIFIFVGVWGMRQVLTCFGGVMLVQVLLLTTLSSLTAQLDPYFSTRLLAETISERAGPQDRIVAYGVSYENSLQTLPFYAQRRVAVFGDPGELTLGRDHTPDAARQTSGEARQEAAAWFASEESAQAALLREPAGFWGVTDEEHWGALQQVSASFEKIDEQGHLVLFQRNP